MPLPPPEKVMISADKLISYLLNPVHPEGKSKARWFLAQGFRAETYEVLEQAIRDHVLAEESEIVMVIPTPFGVKYRVEGKLSAPTGRTFLVRSIWNQDSSSPKWRLITCYPLRRKPR